MSSLRAVRSPFALTLALATLLVGSGGFAAEPAPLAAKADASSDHASPRREPPPSVNVRLFVGVEVASRSFAYSDPLKTSTNLRPYDLGATGLFVFGVELLPLVWTRVSILSSLTIAGEYAFAPSLTSSLTGGKEIPTSFERGRLLLRAPIRLGGRRHRAVLSPSIGYESLVFDFQDTGELSAEIPSVHYKLLRFGLDGRTRVFGPLSVLGSFAWLEPLSGGPLYERFRDVSVSGIDVGLGLGLRIAKGMEIRLSASYTRFFSTFLPVPGDAYVAGGALDEFGGLRLGAHYDP